MTNAQAQQIIHDCARQDYDEEPTHTWRAQVRSVLLLWTRQADNRDEVKEAIETVGGIDAAVTSYISSYEEIHAQEYGLDESE